MSFLRSLAKETAIYGGSTILNRLLNYVMVTPYLTRVFAEERGEYGIHGLMYAFAALLMVLFTYGMETAFFRFGSQAEQRGTAFSTATISLLVSTALAVGTTVLLAPSISEQLLAPGYSLYVVLFAFVIGFDVLAAVPFAMLRLENRPLRFALLKAGNVLLNLLALVFFLEICPLLAASGQDWAARLYDPEQKLLYVFGANLIASAFTLLFFLPVYLRLQWRFDTALWRRMMHYALPLVPVGIAGTVNQLADRYLLKIWLPGTTEANLEQVGIYNACLKIAVLMMLFTQAFKFAAEPFFFRHAARSDSRQIYADVSRAFAIAGSFACLATLLYLDYVKILIDANYHEGLRVVPVLLLAYFFLGMYYNFSIWYKLSDQTHIGAWISIGGAAITLGLNYWLIPILGYVGSAWAAVACYGFMNVASYLIGQRYYPIPYAMWRMKGILAAAIVTYLLSVLLQGATTGHLLLATVVNTLLLVAFMAFVAKVEGPWLQSMLRRQ